MSDWCHFSPDSTCKKTLLTNYVQKTEVLIPLGQKPLLVCLSPYCVFYGVFSCNPVSITLCTYKPHLLLSHLSCNYCSEKTSLPVVHEEWQFSYYRAGVYSRHIEKCYGVDLAMLFFFFLPDVPFIRTSASFFWPDSVSIFCIFTKTHPLSPLSALQCDCQWCSNSTCYTDGLCFVSFVKSGSKMVAQGSRCLLEADLIPKDRPFFCAPSKKENTGVVPVCCNRDMCNKDLNPEDYSETCKCLICLGSLSSFTHSHAMS